MGEERESAERRTISKGIWSTQLYKHIEYFNACNDIREIKIVLPFGIPRERKPKNWEKKQREAANAKTGGVMQNITASNMGSFYYQPEAEIEPWVPRLKQVKETSDQVQNKPTLFVMRFDPSDKKVMYLEQDLMAKPITNAITKITGFSYRLQEDKNVILRKYIVLVDEDKMIKLVHEFVKECNRVLFMHCDTK